MIEGLASVRVLAQLLCMTAAVGLASLVLFRSNATSERAFLALASVGLIVVSVVLISQHGVLWSLPVEPVAYWPLPGELPALLVGAVGLVSVVLIAGECLQLGGTHWRLRALSEAKDDSVVSALAAACSSLGLTSRVRVAIDPRIAGPAAASLSGRVILLPERFREWPNETLQAVIAHEVVHLARRDDVWLVFWRLLAKAYWFIPWMHWLPHRFRAAAEASCDDRAAEVCADGVAYCEALAVAAHTASSRGSLNARPRGTMAALSHALLARLQRFITPRQQDLDTYGLYWAMLIVLVALPLLISVRFTGLPDSSTFQVRQLTLTEPGQASEVASAFAAPRISAHYYHIDRFDQLVPTRLTTASPMRRPQLPIYPGSALRAGMQKDVWVEFGIAQDGRVVRPRIVSDHTPRAFVRASLSAIERSEFEPAINLAGSPPESRARMRVLHRYRIADSSP